METTAHENLTDTRPAGASFRALAKVLLSEYAVLLASVLYFLIALPFVPGLATGGNLSNVASDVLPLLAVAAGQTVVLITGGIDLSVTSVIALSSVTGAALMSESRGFMAGSAAAVPAAVAAMLLVGAGVGLLNGVAVALLGMPPFIVTLATMTGVGGAAVWATRSRNIADLPEAFVSIGSGSFLGVPYPLWVVGALVVSIHVLLSRTLAGRWLYAVGRNAKTARVSGVPVATARVLAYAVSGACGAVASILYTARLETGSPTLGREILLDVIGAAVIGGTSLFGGRGKVVWTAFGVLFFTLLSDTLTLLGLQHYTVMTVKGAVILLAAALDAARVRYLDAR